MSKNSLTRNFFFYKIWKVREFILIIILSIFPINFTFPLPISDSVKEALRRIQISQALDRYEKSFIFPRKLVLCNYPLRSSLGKKISFDLGVGVESLKYEEHIPVDSHNLFHTESEARVTNIVLRALGEYNFENNFFIGIKGVMPISKGDDTEKWDYTDLGINYQTNKLKYGWSRIDGYIGYIFELPSKNFLLADTLEPYLGIRASWGRQRRSNFNVLGVPLTTTPVTEKIDSYGVLLAFRAKKVLGEDFEERFSLGFNFEWVFPLDVETTNTDFPGLTIGADKGYTWRMGASCRYKFTENWFIKLGFYGGVMHWEGSGWIRYKAGFVKWPENDTTYFGGEASLNFSF